MALSRLIYVSEPQLDTANGSIIAQLGSIMSASRRNNEAADITGALVYDESWFLQVLEGERHSIWQTFTRINEDERHGGCLLVEMVDTDHRLFGNWWMGLATRDAVTASAFLPYLDRGVLRADAMSGRDVLALMTAVAKLGLNREMRAAA
jgi:hypothetical protein